MSRDFGASLTQLAQSQSKSSFGPARFFLTPAPRRGLEALYAYCRSVDDAADELPPLEGRRVLAAWRKTLALIKKGQTDKLPPVAKELAEFSQDFSVPPSLLAELIDGALSDLGAKVRFARARDLDLYCHRVAGVVGQACLPLFGVPIKAGKKFAETLGRALQWINFIRDAAEDAADNRIYFPATDLKKYKVKEKDWLAGKPGPGGQAMLIMAAEKAEAELDKAWVLRGRLQGRLKPAEMMADVYGNLLKRMRRDGCRVFEKRYRVPALVKISLFARRGCRDGR